MKACPDERATFPELYSAPKGWYGTHYVARLSKELPEDTLRQKYMIPKCYLIDRLCSDDYNNTNRKSLWHIDMLWEAQTSDSRRGKG